MNNQVALSRRSLAGTEVGAIGLGLMGMSFAYGPTDADEAIATINEAIDSGVTLLDTADMYASGANEELLARVLADRRDEVFVATKFGIVVDPETGMPDGTVNGSPEYVRNSIDGSLRRLGTDHVDLYYQHRADPAVPIEETVGAMAELVTAGKVGAIGLSEPSAETIRRAATVHPIAAVQSEWSIFSRDIESGVVAAAREIGAALVPYSPLGRGLLTGAASASTDLAADDFRRTLPRWQGEALDANLAVVASIRQIANRLGATPAQVALAWVLAQGADVIPIPGTKRRSYLRDNLGADALVLSAVDLQELSALAPVGSRYPDMSWVGRDTAAFG